MPNSPNLIVVSFVMVFLCTGFVEELTFRGLTQYNAIKMLGKWKAIFFSTRIHGASHRKSCICGLSYSVHSKYAFFIYKGANWVHLWNKRHSRVNRYHALSDYAFTKCSVKPIQQQGSFEIHCALSKQID